MLKITGIIFLFGSCLAFGLHKASLLYARKNRLSALCLFIEELSDRIRTGEELTEIIDRSGGAAGINREGCNIRVSGDALEPEVLRLANDFFKELGMGDTQSQLKRCEAYREFFEKARTNAEKTAAAKGILYGKLGLFAGLLLAVVLI